MSPRADASETPSGRPTPQPPLGWVDCGAVARNKQLVRYLARAETSTDAMFVIKHRPPGGQVPQARFDRECELMRQLGSTPGVIAIEQFDDQLPARWFIMPRAELLGGHLGPQPHLREVVAAVKPIADTLASVAERFGTAHRDIKPANLLWLDAPLVADFGIAQVSKLSDLTRAGEKVGPYEFLAPEMRETAADTDGKPADVWSLAKTLFVLAHADRSTWPPVGTLTAERSEFSLRAAGGQAADDLAYVLEAATAYMPHARMTMAAFAAELGEWLERHPPGTAMRMPTPTVDDNNVDFSSFDRRWFRLDAAVRRRRVTTLKRKLLDVISHVASDSVLLRGTGGHLVGSYDWHEDNFEAMELVSSTTDTTGRQFVVAGFLVDDQVNVIVEVQQREAHGASVLAAPSFDDVGSLEMPSGMNLFTAAGRYLEPFAEGRRFPSTTYTAEDIAYFND